MERTNRAQIIVSIKPLRCPEKSGSKKMQTFPRGRKRLHPILTVRPRGDEPSDFLRLAAEVVEGDVLFTDAQIIEHLKHRGIHHGWSADVELDVLGRGVFA